MHLYGCINFQNMSRMDAGKLFHSLLLKGIIVDVIRLIQVVE